MQHALRFIRDNLPLFVSAVSVAILAGAWIIFEALRSHARQNEIFRLKRKIAALEREKAAGNPSFTDPVVLSSRWIRSGTAAASSDGGCLLLLDKVDSAARSAELTLRIDGFAAVRNHRLQAGQRLEAEGRNGTYILELQGVQGIQANVAIALRSRHRQAEA